MRLPPLAANGLSCTWRCRSNNCRRPSQRALHLLPSYVQQDSSWLVLPPICRYHCRYTAAKFELRRCFQTYVDSLQRRSNHRLDHERSHQQMVDLIFITFFLGWLDNWAFQHILYHGKGVQIGTEFSLWKKPVFLRIFYCETFSHFKINFK